MTHHNEAENLQTENTHKARRRRLYRNVFLGLAALTLLEIGVSFLPIPTAPFLAALAVGKIVLVAMFYMHLKTDSRWFMYAILIPIPFVVLILVALVVAF